MYFAYYKIHCKILEFMTLYILIHVHSNFLTLTRVVPSPHINADDGTFTHVVAEEEDNY
jgi:hypothetical protein